MSENVCLEFPDISLFTTSKVNLEIPSSGTGFNNRALMAIFIPVILQVNVLSGNSVKTL